MFHFSRFRAPASAILLFLGAGIGRAAPLISEFVAVNVSGLKDDDGDYSDWIEIHNPDSTAFDLDGWHLTDREDKLDKWTFPPVLLPSGGFLVVFASEKNRNAPDTQLHTNFKLSGDGEFLALVAPDAKTVVSKFAPYPVQVANVAYGVSFALQPSTVLAAGAAAKFLVPDAITGVALAEEWVAPEFVEGAGGDTWTSAASGIGFGITPPELVGAGGNTESRMRNTVSGAYCRLVFDVSNLSQVNALTLRMKYDDGFVAFLNGEEVARSNAPADGADGLPWDSSAVMDRPGNSFGEFETFDLTSQLSLLEQGLNVLAIHGLNAGAASEDFLILPEISTSAFKAQAESPGYLPGPTPGAANLVSSAKVGPVVSSVQHSPESPGDEDPIVVTAAVSATLEPVDSVTLTHRTGFTPTATLPMLDDGIAPDAIAGDGIYTAVIPAASSTPGDMVRWKVTAADDAGTATNEPAFRSPTGSPAYLGTVISDPASASALPMLHWFVQNTAAAETASGTRASLSYNGEFYDNVFVRIRGDTARSWPKKAYKFDFNDGHHFRFDPALPRVGEININTTYTDKSYSRTVLAYGTFRDSGSPYPVAFPVRVERNSAFYSVALFVEQPDRDYLRRNGLDSDGALYKAKANSIRGVSSFNVPATSGIQKKNRTTENFSDLQSLITNLGRKDAALGNYLFDNINIPAVVNNMAANVVIQNIDRTVKNFYLYRDTAGSGEWMLFPWDVDLSFGPNSLNTNTIVTAEDTGNNSSHPFMGTSLKPYSGLWNGLLDAIINRPETREMFLRRVRTLGDQFLNTTYYGDRIDQLATLLGPDVTKDRAKWGGNAHFSGTTLSLTGETNRIKNEYLPGRRKHLFVTHAAAGTGPVLVPESSTVKALVPTDDSLGDSWKLAGFDDSPWLAGTNAVGYERSATGAYAPLLGIDLLSPSIPASLRIDADADNINDNNSCYLRYAFNLTDRNAVTFLKLRLKYDDGFTAFLNGTRVAGRNEPSPSAWNAEATAENPDSKAVAFEDINISAFKSLLVTGTNVLAVQAMNRGSTGSDMLFSCELADASSSPGTAVGIPPSQLPAPAVNFGAIEFNPPSGNQDGEFIELVNPNAFSVDLSGWSVEGGITHTLKPGTVLPAGGRLYLSPDVKAFRARVVSPTGGEGRFVQGSYAGHLSNFGETLTLRNAAGTLISQATTAVAPSNAQRYLVVTEVMYNPAGDGGAEFIELMNISDSVTLDLTGVQFAAGVSFGFAGSAVTSLAPGARVLVVRDLTAFTAAHGTGLPIAGVFSELTKLDNNGETLKLEDSTHSTVREFTYNDKTPWPTAANGSGASLVLIRPQSNPDPGIATNWRPSALPGGSPGGTDSQSFTGNPDADTNGNGIADLIDHALEGGTSRLTGDGTGIRFQYVRNLAADDVDVTLQISTDLQTWSEASALFSTVENPYPANGRQPVTLEASRAALPAYPLFLRLKIARP